MSKLSILVLLITIRIFYNPTETKSSPAGFVSPAAFQVSARSIVNNSFANLTARIINNQVWLNEKEETIWCVQRNNQIKKEEKI